MRLTAICEEATELLRPHMLTNRDINMQILIEKVWDGAWESALMTSSSDIYAAGPLTTLRAA